VKYNVSSCLATCTFHDNNVGHEVTGCRYDLCFRQQIPFIMLFDIKTYFYVCVVEFLVA